MSFHRVVHAAAPIHSSFTVQRITSDIMTQGKHHRILFLCLALNEFGEYYGPLVSLVDELCVWSMMTMVETAAFE